MVVHRWWFTEDEWVKYSLIAAPLMIVFALALITIRTCRKRSYIYKPPCDHGLSDSLYGLTTTDAISCTEKDPMLGGEEERDRGAVGERKPRVRFDRGGDEYVIYETDSSVVGSLREEGMCPIWVYVSIAHLFCQRTSQVIIIVTSPCPHPFLCSGTRRHV